MAPPALRPENALKRADELISVGDSQAALQSLYDYITARRIRFAQPSAIEPIVFRFLELGVELKRGRFIKDALHQYKKLVQGSPEGLISVGAICRKYVDFVEKKMALEQVQADESQKGEQDEDLEGGVTAENLLKSAYLQDQSVGGFNDEVLTSWLKFSWESYRAILDLVRNNSQLEITYAGVVNRTMQFCLKYNRKNEFKRLAEMLRQHLDAANYQQSKSGSNIVDLNDSETLQRYLDQRFQQVTVSVKLELWHEAYRSIEDVYHLMKISKQSPRAFTLATHYKNLAKVLLISNAQLLHTVAWEKFYQLYSTNPKASEDDFKRFSSIILLSAVSSPLDELPTVGYDPQMRLYRLLGLESRPSRQEIISLAKNEEIFSKVDEDIKELYELLEVNFDAETIYSQLVTLLPKLESKPYFEEYVTPLKNLIIRKLLVSISENETSINIDQLYERAGLPGQLSQSYWDMEKSLLQAAVEDYVSFTIDHSTNTVTFVKDPFEVISKEISTTEEEEEEEEEEIEEEEHEGEEIPEIDEIPEVEGEEEEEETKEPEPVLTRTSYIRKKLSELSGALYELESFKNASYLQKVKIVRENLISETKESVQNLKEVAEERIKRAQEQKQIYLASAAERAEEDAEVRQIRMLEEKATLEAKIEEEARRRMVEKKKREFEAIKSQEIKKFVEVFNAKGQGHLTNEEVEGLEIPDIRKLIVSKLSKDKNELEEKLNYSIQRLDHTERAYRKSELPLLKKESESLRANDMGKFNELKDQIIKTAKVEHEAKMEDHQRLIQVYDDFKQLRDRLYYAYDQRTSTIIAEKKAQLEAAKNARIEEVRQQRYDELVAEQKAEITRAEREERNKKQDEMARKQREMEEAAERKLQSTRTASISAPFVADNERRAKLDDIARRQREMEDAAEKKAQAGRAPASSTPTSSFDRPLTFKEKMMLKKKAAEGK